MQKRTSGGKIREKVTGESLSSYYEEQKGGKKVEIGGKKERWGGGTRWWRGRTHGEEVKEALEKGKGVGAPSSPFPLSGGREWKKQERGRRNGAQAWSGAYLSWHEFISPSDATSRAGWRPALPPATVSWDSYSTLLCHRCCPRGDELRSLIMWSSRRTRYRIDL